MTVQIKNSSVLTIVLAFAMFGCSRDEPKIAATINQIASLGGDLPANPLQWRVITSAINTADSTMSTLYGNDIALQYARSNAERNYPAGAVLALVTWKQREDPRYFGAKIPGAVKSVEFATMKTAADGHPWCSYERYEGTPLKRQTADSDPLTVDRANYLLSQRAAVLP